MKRVSTLGQRVRELRLKKGMNQIELAKGLCTPSMISQIESDRARPSYKMLSSIAERLDVPLERLLVDVDLNMEYVSTYKMARAMMKSNEYSSAIPLLRELVESPRAQISTMDILFDLGECYLHTGQTEDSEEMFNQVYELAVLRQDTLLQTLVRKNFGKLAFAQRKYQLAIFQWQKALEELDKTGEKDVYLQAELLFHVGEVHLKTGCVEEAAGCFDRAALVYEDHSSLREMGHAYMALGQSYKRMNEFQKASMYSERATAIFETLENRLMTFKLQVTNAALLADTGRFDEAESLLHSTMAKLKDLDHKEVEGMAFTELAHLYERKGEWEKAEEACRTARPLLPEHLMYQAKINRIQAKIAVKRENVQEAIPYLQSAADGFQMSGETGEWEDTMFELSRLYLQENDLHQVIRIMDDMRSYTRSALVRRGIQL